jgi:hypothetical protein
VKTDCPTCGAPVEFRYDDSFVRVCAHCRSAVVRSDRGVESLGKTADLVDIESPIKLFTEGRYRGLGFMVVGRTQLRHHMGGTWQEWYAKMDDGRWGWLAEAQGRYYLTFEIGVAPPIDYDHAEPGARVTIEDEGPRQLVINEKGMATYASAEGEIPYRFTPGAAFRFVDLGDAEGRFATIDYGAPDAPGVPSLYLGRQATLAELGLSGGEVGPATSAKIASKRLACPECDGALEVRAPDAAQRIACPYCGALLDTTSGALALLRKLDSSERGSSPIPLGSTCTFEGAELTAIGHVQRAAIVDGMHYPFDEVLLHAPSLGFRWLVCSDGHWSYVQPVLPAAIEPDANGVRYDRVAFRQFQSATLEVKRVVGEFYWQVEIGETVEGTDYIAPPAMLSSERSGTELTWSLGRYVRAKDLRRAFGDKVDPPGGARGVAPNQPSPFGGLGVVLGLAIAAFAAAFLGLQAMSRNRTITQQRAEFVTAEFAGDPTDPTAAAPPAANVWFSEEFTLAGGDNIAIDLTASVANSWIAVGGDLIESSGIGFEMFDRDIEYYFGVADGESWTEGSQHETVMLPAQNAGAYVLRLEASTPGGSPPPIDVRVRQDVFVYRMALYALIAVFAPALILVILSYSFERRRWSDSTMAPSIYTIRAGDDE